MRETYVWHGKIPWALLLDTRVTPLSIGFWPIRGLWTWQSEVAMSASSKGRGMAHFQHHVCGQHLSQRWAFAAFCRPRYLVCLHAGHTAGRDSKPVVQSIYTSESKSNRYLTGPGGLHFSIESSQLFSGRCHFYFSFYRMVNWGTETRDGWQI